MKIDDYVDVEVLNEAYQIQKSVWNPDADYSKLYPKDAILSQQEPYYVIDIPISSEGFGPCSYEECSYVEFQVWDRFCICYYSSPILATAINAASYLNKKFREDFID